MTNRNYANGSVFENQVKKHLESCGFLAFRSAGSHGIADVIGVLPSGSTVLVQCKKSGIFPKDEIEKLAQASKKYRCSFLLAHHKTRGKITFTNLAGETIGT